MNALLNSKIVLLSKIEDDIRHWAAKDDEFWSNWKGDSKNIILSRLEKHYASVQAEISKLSH